MLNSPAGAGAKADERLAGARPTRLITYAWGEKYLELLLSLNLPALLAPGNLPYVAAKVPCQVVILTEERFFHRVASHLAVAQVKTFCDVRLVALDDVIAVPDKYGMALSYVLHRGFADLGPAMTDSWQIFLNADFILSDGSLRALLPRLARGERIVAAPSYCVNAEAVLPELRQRIDPQTLALSLPPRELAALILRHRHNTIRGKTVNQRAISMRYMDQFYWEADPNTLLGYQMPVAIVGLRPQRHLSEPNAYWDHGLMREFCPDAEVCVIGDSDEFLMLELRGEDTAADQMSLGWPTPAEIASRMIVFLTPYQREYLRYPLTLHAADLPTDVEGTRAKLEAHIGEVFAHVPEVLPSHRNHPQWQYHLPAFTKSRHDCLSKRLGLRTTTTPPDTMSALDQAWWRLDGLEKLYHLQRKQCIQAMERDLRWVDDALIAMPMWQANESNDTRTWSQADLEILQELAALAEQSVAGVRAEDAMAITLHRQSLTGSERPPTAQTSLDAQLTKLLDRRRLGGVEGELVRLEGARNVIADHYERRLLLLDADYEATRHRLQTEYDRLMPKGARDAGIPHIAVRNGPIDIGQPTNPLLVRVAKKAYCAAFGKLPRVTHLHPQWATLRHVVRSVDAVAEAGGTNVFVVSSRPNTIERLADGFTGKHVRLTPAVALSDNFPLAFEQIPDFHLCLCILEYPELRQFHKIVKAMAPCMRPGGKIVGFHMNSSLAPLPTNDPNLIVALSRLVDPVRVHYAGSPQSAAALAAIQHAGGNQLTDPVPMRHAGLPQTAEAPAEFESAGAGGGRGLVRAARVVLALLRIAPQALAANRAAAAMQDDDTSGPPALCTSITLEVTVSDYPQATRPHAPAHETQAAGLPASA